MIYLVARYVKDLTMEQLVVYNYLQKEIADGMNLIDLIHETDEAFDSIPEKVTDTFSNLNDKEKIEVIYFASRYALKNE